MSGFKTILYEKTDKIAYISLNRPHALNAYNVQMRDELYEVLTAIKIDEDVRVVIIKGVGKKGFCGGADLSEFLTAPSPVIARRVRWGRDIWGLFRSIPQPIIVALHGYVLGSGIEMALLCDIIIAADNARIGFPEVGLGIIPAAGGTQTLPRSVGKAKAMELLFTNQWIDAKEALRIRLVNRVVASEKLSKTIEKIALKIASYNPTSVKLAKQAVNRGMELPLSIGLEIEKILVYRLGIGQSSAN
jgi:enoyl-CoA hydratase/carnithine racemase